MLKNKIVAFSLAAVTCCGLVATSSTAAHAAAAPSLPVQVTIIPVGTVNVLNLAPTADLVYEITCDPSLGYVLTFINNSIVQPNGARGENAAGPKRIPCTGLPVVRTIRMLTVLGKPNLHAGPATATLSFSKPGYSVAYATGPVELIPV